MTQEKIGKYQILEKLGQGGMGVVYKALDTLIERVVAVKMMAVSLDDDPDQRTRFFREARSAGQLSHKNIVTIFDMGEESGRAYIAMEFLEGRDLRAEITKGKPLTLRDKLRIVTEICEALAHAHEKGVIHRDIKPANVFILNNGQVKILDFGLARTRSSELTTSGHAMGTPNYMSPEQIRGEKVDHRADIFSVGVLFYELLTRKKAFQGDSFTSTIYKILQEDPLPIESVDPAVPPALCDLVYRALAKDREERYQSLPELLADLETLRHSPQMISALAAADSNPSGGPNSAGEAGTVDPEEPSEKTVVDESLKSGGSRRSVSSRPTISRPPGLQLLAESRPPAARAEEREEGARIEKQPPARARSLRPVVVTVAFVLVASLVWIGFHYGAGRGARSAAAQSAPSASPAANQPAPAKGESAAATPPGSEPTSVAAANQAPASAPPTPQKPPETAEETRKVPESPAAGVGDQAASRAARENAVDLARRRAEQARAQLAEFKPRAEEARGSKAAAQFLDAAVAAEAVANHLYGQGRFADAQAKYVSAGDLFARAVTEARAENAANTELARKAAAEKEQAALRAKSETSKQGYESEREAAIQAGAPVKAREVFGQAEKYAAGARVKFDNGDYAGAAHDYDIAAATIRGAQSLALEAARREAARPVEASPPPAQPPAAVQPAPDPGAALEAAQKAISAIPDQYKAAMEGKDAELLKSIWPGLSSQQEQAFRKQWSYTRSLRITPRQSKIEKLEGDTAIVSVLLHYEQEITDGTSMRWDQKATFRLARKGRTWFIESAGFQALH